MSLSVTYFPSSSVSCYTGIFVTFEIFSLFLLVSGCFVFKGLSIESTESNTENVLPILWERLYNMDTLMFLLTTLVNGIVQASAYTFTFLYLKDLGAPTILLGASMAFGTMCSILTYHFSKEMIGWFNGTLQTLSFSCFAWAVRCFGVAYLTNPFYVLITDLLNGVSYSLYVICALEHVKDTTDVRILTTMTGIVNALHNSVGYAIAGFVAGNVYHVYGGKILFVGISLLSFIWTIVIVCYVYVNNRRKHYESLNQSTDFQHQKEKEMKTFSS